MNPQCPPGRVAHTLPRAAEFPVRCWHTTCARPGSALRCGFLHEFAGILPIERLGRSLTGGPRGELNPNLRVSRRVHRLRYRAEQFGPTHGWTRTSDSPAANCESITDLSVPGPGPERLVRWGLSSLVMPDSGHLPIPAFNTARQVPLKGLRSIHKLVTA
jgi:hypothetical protein